MNAVARPASIVQSRHGRVGQQGPGRKGHGGSVEGSLIQRGPGSAPCSRNRGGCTNEIDALATLRRRYGIVLDNGLLPFVTAGIAVAKVSATAGIGACGATQCTVDGTQIGYTVGAGIEVPMPDRWSLRTQFDYIDLGTEQFEGESSANRNIEADLTYSRVSVSFQRRF